MNRVSAAAKLWYVAVTIWAVAFVIALIKGELAFAAINIVVCILCLVVADES